ncbi:hypothetical protein HanIR_Chr12g0595331 [Helianthus annuus]|nr:hypothetical protein HanIR_Chr12g0595331 [Helianthus annuus]
MAIYTPNSTFTYAAYRLHGIQSLPSNHWHRQPGFIYAAYRAIRSVYNPSDFFWLF